MLNSCHSVCQSVSSVIFGQSVSVCQLILVTVIQSVLPEVHSLTLIQSGECDMDFQDPFLESEIQVFRINFWRE